MEHPQMFLNLLIRNDDFINSQNYTSSFNFPSFDSKINKNNQPWEWNVQGEKTTITYLRI